MTDIEPTKQREGDQVLPTGDESIPDDQALLIDDIEARRQVGIERYGQGHRPFNGRDTLLDAYEEQLDFLVYLRSLRRMAAATREDLIREVAQKVSTYGWSDETNGYVAILAVDAIMGWVVGHGRSEQEQVDIVVDALRTAQHTGNTNYHAAVKIVEALRS